MTPVREAIRRLISDGALEFKGNRRVSVPILREADLQELVFIRKSVETELAFRAAQRIDRAGIAMLRRIDRDLDTAILAGDVRGYLRNNYRFHACLNAWSDAPIMAEITDRLWLRFGPSLRVVCGRFGTQNLPDRHKDMIAALERGAARDAAEAMEQDILQGMDQIAQVLRVDAEPD
jgi:DNA-binding GntR family transcriptional regulator